MKYGVIDIGSNTIKAFVYDGEDNYRVISSMHRPTKLINYISESVMSVEGIKKAVDDICLLKEFLTESGCDEIYSYATSATRDCINSAQIVSEINSVCGLDTDLLSGKAEALCDAKGATLLGIKDFICVDLGGGSCQMCEYYDGELYSAVSWPAGALRTKRHLGGGDFPDDELKEKTRAFIGDMIRHTQVQRENIPVILMGGASQSTKNIIGSAGVSPEVHGAGIFSAVYDSLAAMPGEERTELLITLAPLRHDIIGYALIILDVIINHISPSEIIFTKAGSREGYLLYKLEGTNFNEFV